MYLRLLCICILSLFSLGHEALAASAVTIWPVNPVLGAGAKASALWLENNDRHSVLLQVRVFRWRQNTGADDLVEQTEIVASPPMVNVPPSIRQLIRLMRMGPSHAETETAYRVIIDEIPTAETQELLRQSSAQISMQFRYSIPLFVYDAHGLSGAENPASVNDIKAHPVLHWTLKMHHGQRFLSVRNSGVMHAQLSEVSLGGIKIAGGLLGYVLPGCTMEWPLGERQGGGPLKAIINGALKAEVIPAQP